MAHIPVDAHLYCISALHHFLSCYVIVLHTVPSCQTNADWAVTDNRISYRARRLGRAFDDRSGNLSEAATASKARISGSRPDAASRWSPFLSISSTEPQQSPSSASTRTRALPRFVLSGRNTRSFKNKIEGIRCATSFVYVLKPPLTLQAAAGQQTTDTPRKSYNKSSSLILNITRPRPVLIIWTPVACLLYCCALSSA